MLVSGSTGPVVIQGNFIGTDKTGNIPMGNLSWGYGIYVYASNVQIGGSAVGEGNVIGSRQTGIAIDGVDSTGNLVQGNSIGVGANGHTAISNGYGIYLDGSATHNTIGGTAPGTGNTIGDNLYAGIAVVGPTQAEIRGNSIFGNGGLGIDLARMGSR